MHKGPRTRRPAILKEQSGELVLVKGGPGSRLLTQATCISETDKNRVGRPLKVLSHEMRKVFGHFGGQNSIERSPPRWVPEAFAERAAAFVRSLE